MPVGGWFRSNTLPLLLLGLALGVRVATALPLQQPGYMDAYYYYNVAQRLHAGQGLTDPYLWNFLDNPETLPHPACLYWMPLSSFIIYPFFLAFGVSFRVAQVPFILLSALLVLLAYRVALGLSDERSGRRHALLAGLLVIFSGYYVAFWTMPDNFAPFAVTAGLALYCAGRGLTDGRVAWFVGAGLCAGLAHLARADGLLVLAAVLAAVAVSGLPPSQSSVVRAKLGAGLLSLLAYGVVMAPWFYRDWLVAGRPLASGGIQTLFLRSYDELFSYGRGVTVAHYLAWGWPAIVRSKLQGLGFGLLNLIAVNWMIFLAPLAVVGLWALRPGARLDSEEHACRPANDVRDWRSRIELLPVGLYAVGLYATMTLGFTFPGIRGGLLHSSAALLPWWFAAAAVGLDRVVEAMVARRPRWSLAEARRGFSVGVVLLAVLLSGFLYLRAAAGAWNQRDSAYADVGAWLAGNGAAGARVMVNNVPGFYYHTGLSGVSIPDEELPLVLDAARRYEIGYLVLEVDHPQPIDALYQGQVTPPGVMLAATLHDAAGRPVKIFRLEQQGP